MDPVTIETDRLVLRPLNEGDTQDILDSWTDPEVRRWTAVPEKMTLSHAEYFIRHVCPEGWREDRNLMLGIEVQETSEFVGMVGVFGLSWVGLSEQLAWVGYWSLERQRRKGYVVEALRALCGWAFSALCLDRLEAVIELGNEASLACAQRAGFLVEGKHRARVVQDGTRRDAWVASLLPQDFGQPSCVPYPGSMDETIGVAGSLPPSA